MFRVVAMQQNAVSLGTRPIICEALIMFAPRARSVVWLAGLLLLCACGWARPSGSATQELGCGRGGYAGLPAVQRRATFPDPALLATRAAGLYVVARDAAGGAAIPNLRLQLTGHTDSLLQHTSVRGDATFLAVGTGTLLLDARQFNFLPARDSLPLRAGFVDTMELHLGRMGQECYIVPDRQRQ
jgi:hypothetical protein